jgi:2-dehydropantoate 2-reductase
MRFVVYGAGGIGGVIGFRLAQHGHDVALIARGPHHDAIRERGLRLDGPDDERSTMAIPVADHPAALDLGPDDVVLLAMKSQDTAGALDALQRCAPRDLPIVCLQNGLANERAALRRFPRVYGVPVICPTGHLEPGVVIAYSAPTTGILDVGCYPSGVDDLARELCAAFAASTFEAEPRADVMRWKTGKLLANLSNAAEAVCGAGFGSSMHDLARDEAIGVLRAAGIPFVDRDEDLARRGDAVHVRPAGDQPRPGASSTQSLHRGTGTIEADYLNGEIVLLGRLHGVPTPVNETLQRLANRAARAHTPPASMTEEDVLAAVRAAAPVGSRARGPDTLTR